MGCLSRSMTIKAHNKIEADLLDYQCVTLSFSFDRPRPRTPSTPENKDSIDKEQLMKMPKRASLINMASPRGGARGRDA